MDSGHVLAPRIVGESRANDIACQFYRSHLRGTDGAASKHPKFVEHSMQIVQGASINEAR